jgi:hypothetical protein
LLLYGRHEFYFLNKFLYYFETGDIELKFYVSTLRKEVYQVQWFTPVTPTTPEAEVRRIVVRRVVQAKS